MNVLSKRSLRRLAPVLVLVAGLVMGGCYQDYGLSVQDYDAYLTGYAPGTNFQAFKYFVMPDTIMHINPGTSLTDPLASARKYDKQILSLTASNLLARGFTRLTDTTQIGPGRPYDPNTVLVALIGQFSTDHSGYYYDYWYGYWGGYYPGWGYPGYYPPAYVNTYTYTTGSNVTELVQYGKSNADKRAAPVWVGIATGLMGTPSTAQSRLATGINRTFEQSPYLYAGQ